MPPPSTLPSSSSSSRTAHRSSFLYFSTHTTPHHLHSPTALPIRLFFADIFPKGLYTIKMVSDSYYRSLIEAVRQLPVLYDRTHPDFRNVRKRNEAWKLVSETLFKRGFSPNEVSVTKSRDRWKSLVQRYRTSGQFGPAFMFTSEMQFLDEFLNAVPSQPVEATANSLLGNMKKEDSDWEFPVLFGSANQSDNNMSLFANMDSPGGSSSPYAQQQNDINAVDTNTEDGLLNGNCSFSNGNGVSSAHCVPISISSLSVKDLMARKRPRQNVSDGPTALEKRIASSLETIQEFISNAFQKQKEHEVEKEKSPNAALFQCIDHLTADMSPKEHQEALREIKRSCK
ncbi:Transcription factor [Dirofilaria immitis]